MIPTKFILAALIAFLPSVALAHELEAVAGINCMADVIMNARRLKRRQEGAVQFGYDGEKGPLRWSELSKDFALCSTGKLQSPIDFPGNTFLAAANPPPAQFDWKTTKDLEFVNEGTTIKVVMPNKDSSTVVQGTKFTLEQFHFHTPSEHRINGQETSIEMHFVHSDAAGNIHVTGVLLDMFAGGAKGDTKNDFLDQIIPNIPGANLGDKKTIAEVDFTPMLDLLNKSRFNTYTGSLTTPPCAEGLKWVVTAEPLPISTDQFAAITKAVAFNARFVQAINGRGGGFVNGNANGLECTTAAPVTVTVTESAKASTTKKSKKKKAKHTNA